MKTIITATALAAAAFSSGASAQKLSPAVIAVVDTERVSRECTACIAAQTQLRSLLQQAQTRQTQLQTSLRTEGAPIQAAVTALAGKAPDAALQGRIRAFQVKEDSANTELQNRTRTLQSTQANVNQQIGTRLQPIIAAVMQARGASLVVDKGATLASAANIDVTNDVLAQLNQQLPSVSVTPLPAQPNGAAPQGR